jgi:hypothetical protein
VSGYETFVLRFMPKSTSLGIGKSCLLASVGSLVKPLHFSCRFDGSRWRPHV